MEIQFSIYELNEETGQPISGALRTADNENILDLFEQMELFPTDTEVPHYNFLNLGREIRIDEESYEVKDFKLRTTDGDNTLKIRVLVSKI